MLPILLSSVIGTTGCGALLYVVQLYVNKVFIYYGSEPFSVPCLVSGIMTTTPSQIIPETPDVPKTYANPRSVNPVNYDTTLFACV